MSASQSVTPSRQRATILFADIHGYSRLMHKDELGTYQRVRQSMALIRSLIDDYGGRVVQTVGDGVLATFEESSHALRFAIEMQREFRNEGVWNADGDVIAFRIGIDEGEVLVSDSGVQGHHVNIAARIQAIAAPGGICLSRSVREAVGDVVDVPMHSLGPRKLKNIADQLELFAVDVDGSKSSVPLEVISSADQVAFEPELISVAVLPLDDFSDDPRDRHLCDGITGDIITNLSRFRDLSIIAHHSARVISQRKLSSEQLRDQLGIRYIMSGDIQRQGTRIRLRIELIEASSQQVLWSDRFRGDLGDLFGFEDDLTNIVAGRLAIQINEAERRRLARLSKPNVQAYGLILRGQDLSIQFRRESNLHARRLFEQATEIDPRFGRSYAAMSRTFNLDWRYAWTGDPGASLDKAVELARAAIDYDPLDARGYGELGFASLYKKNHDESLNAYERALNLNPNDADLLAEMGDSLTYSGQGERAVTMLKRAMVLNPYYPDWYLWYLGEAYFHLDDYDSTITTLNRMQNKAEAHRLLASSYALIGQVKEAELHAAEVLKVHPTFSVDHWATVPPDKDKEKLKIFIEGLRKSGLK
ncbi:MAG: tetratricopeptide repeat protein [Geminicoccales bacterium]